MAVAAIVLAAGRGTRMRSALPKVLHPIAGRTIIEWVLRSLEHIQPENIFVVTGHGADVVRERLAGQDLTDLTFVDQPVQRGTGHAVQQVMPYLAGFDGDVLVLNGDVPFLAPETVERLVEARKNSGCDATILSARFSDPTGLGRVFSGADGRVERVVEHRDCTAEERLNTLINAGVYCFHWPSLAEVLPKLSDDNDQHELYLPDALALLGEVRAVEVAEPQEVFGINDRVQLAQATRIATERTLVRLMRSGVTIVDPARVSIDDTVSIEPDTVIEPDTHLRGRTQIGTGCRIGPGSFIEDSVVEPDCEIFYSVLRRTRVGAGTNVGPYAHLRPESEIGPGCRIGNFVEIKKATLGERTTAAHLTYIGDATVGSRVNFGAGTVVANYDGRDKHKSVLGDGSSTGANSVLISPVQLGAGVYVAAGTVVTADVASGLVIGRVREVVKPDWQPRWRREEGESPAGPTD